MTTDQQPLTDEELDIVEMIVEGPSSPVSRDATDNERLLHETYNGARTVLKRILPDYRRLRSAEKLFNEYCAVKADQVAYEAEQIARDAR